MLHRSRDAAAAGLLLVVMAALLLSTAHRTSLVFDEVIYAPAGCLYLKTGDLRWNIIHPPLQKYLSALPLVLAGISVPTNLDPLKINEWRVGHWIYFHNRIPATTMIYLSRLPSILFTLLLGLVIFLWVRKRGGPAAALLALAIYAFDPLVLGNGALAMNDIFVAGFFFFALAAFDDWQRSGRWTPCAACGVFAGACVAAKFSGFILLPAMGVALFGKFPIAKGRRLLGAGVIALAASVVLLGVYRFHWPVLRQALAAETSLQTGDGAGFLLGPIPGNGTWYYYPIAVLIKTPLPLLCLWGISIAALLKKRGKLHPLFPAGVFGAAIGLVWLAAVLSHNRFGVRYLLPATPVLAALAGIAYSVAKKEKRVWWGFVVWMAIETLVFHPHHLAYFNELIGGPGEGYKWLDGSNQDWGQDLPSLASYLKTQPEGTSVCMGYFGSNDPAAWGIQYQDILSPAIVNHFRNDRANPVQVPHELLVVSAGLIHNPAGRATYEWLEQKKPAAFLGYTMFVYDITNDIHATLWLADTYKSLNRYRLARRQWERALVISPANGNVGKALSEPPS